MIRCRIQNVLMLSFSSLRLSRANKPLAVLSRQIVYASHVHVILQLRIALIFSMYVVAEKNN